MTASDLVRLVRTTWLIWADDQPCHVRIACEGGSDEHWQVRLHEDAEMPDLVWTQERGLEAHPDGRYGGD